VVTRPPGHDSGHAFDWGAYVAWLVESAGSLAAVADRLCAARGYKDDVASAERALRRLKKRGTQRGGTWGTRAIAVFGLPDAVHARVRWLGQYHARFTDLPVGMCADLVRAWDRPPTTESRIGRAWLALAKSSLALRERRHDDAIAELDRARADLAAAPAAAKLEALYVRTYISSKQVYVRTSLSEVEQSAIRELLRQVDDSNDRACLAARDADHRAYELNRAGDHAGAAALYRALPDGDGTPYFARARRASGLAYARWKQGERDEAATLAAQAAELAGDGGHARIRAMALQLVARITGDADAERRALAIANQLEDETLVARFTTARSSSPARA
jgi:hypothetical protein